MDDRDGWQRGPTTTKTEDEDRRRRLKTEDRRRRGEEAGNRTVDPAEEAVDTGGRSAEEVGNTSHKWCAASAWSVSTALSSLHICWVIKRSGPSRYYCPSSDVGGPKRTVDKDGRLSEDGEADGLPASAAAVAGATIASFAVQTPTRMVMPPPPLLLLIAPARALCFGGKDHPKFRRRCRYGFSHSHAHRMAPTPARTPEAQGRLRTDDNQDGLRGWLATKTDDCQDGRQRGWTTARKDDNEDRRQPGWMAARMDDDED
ncbi:hypothetical protein TYRP_011898 [Tyrophagus putrescentiae]|nr:hypothetical protein TYRP_011898 [Tyrophagus putrescentiae]